MTDTTINSLADLNRLRTAPDLDAAQSQTLREELDQAMQSADWFTVGVMAPSQELALNSLRALETSQGWPPMELVQEAESDGPVFLKANQKEGTVRIRLETGLGEGVLVSGHSVDPSRFTPTWGPFPLTFF